MRSPDDDVPHARLFGGDTNRLDTRIDVGHDSVSIDGSRCYRA
jgi:hypothetical protein